MSEMDIIVCVKHVPETAEADIIIKNGKSIKTEDLVFSINEWDEYAIEEAILIKEKLGGTVTVVTVGPKESEETLRRCLAKGADRAIRLDDEVFRGSDGYAIAKILYGFVKDAKFDLVLTGAQASDDGYAQVGVTLAELLGIPHAALVTKIELGNGKARVNRELEGGLEEVIDIDLPAVFTIQTGINEPRYVSIMGIRRARKKELKVLRLKDIAISEEEVGDKGSRTFLEKLYITTMEKKAEILEGSPDETAGKLANILDRRGLI